LEVNFGLKKFLKTSPVGNPKKGGLTKGGKKGWKREWGQKRLEKPH